MDFATLAGMIMGIIFILIGILLTGNLRDYYDMASIMITLGGTFAATLVNYPFSKLTSIFKVTKNLFLSKEEDPNDVIARLIEFANIARKEGMLVLEDAAEQVEDPFLHKGLLLIVDGTDPELLRNIMETDISFIEERHNQGQGIFKAMGAYAPAFGMVGTLIGLINMLKSLDDIASLGPNMAVALVTTFYGSVLANLIFLPMAGKLEYRSSQEILLKEIMLEGILSIQAGENPRIIEEKLKAFLPSKYRTVQKKEIPSVGGEEVA
jgi:chemotaxis protein MotA